MAPLPLANARRLITIITVNITINLTIAITIIITVTITVINIMKIIINIM